MNASTLVGAIRARGGIRATWARRYYNWRVLVACGLLSAFTAKHTACDGDEMAERMVDDGLLPQGYSGDDLINAMLERLPLYTVEFCNAWTCRDTCAADDWAREKTVREENEPIPF